MPANKNQHFVPKTHLKPFTDDQEGRAISLYNALSGKTIHGAPVRSQCSRDYFYGKNLDLEYSLGEIEQRYANQVELIQQAMPARTQVAAELMRFFWCLQWARTEGAAQMAKSMAQGAADTFGLPIFKADAKHNWVITTLSCLKKAVEVTADLSMVLVRNKTELPFITSDDPAILTNRYHLVDSRLKGGPFGMHSAGALLLLPLTPWHLVIFYDRDVYSFAATNNWIDARQEGDVAALNQHQVLNCHRNIYFSRQLSHGWIADTFASLADQRALPEWTYKYAVLDGKFPGRDRFRIAPYRSEEKPKEALIMTTAVARRPKSWPSFLGWRMRGLAYDSRSGAGIVRHAQVQANPGARSPDTADAIFPITASRIRRVRTRPTVV